MIQKFICWIFGHERTSNDYNHPFNQKALENGLEGRYYYITPNKICPRCGQTLKQ